MRNKPVHIALLTCAILLPAQAQDWALKAPQTTLSARDGHAAYDAARGQVVLENWAAPLYWQPSAAEAEASSLRPEVRGADPKATTPAGSLVFVAMTPCRVVDTRASQGFPSPFGSPSLSPGPARSFPIDSSMLCTIPSYAMAYSVIVTIVPPGPVGYLIVWPTGQAQPNVVTLDDLPGDIRQTGAIIPAGTPNGSISAVVSATTDLVIDINGYYAPATGITLDRGTMSAPSLSFSGDAGTGIFSPGAGVVNITSAGHSALTVGGSNFNTAIGAGALETNTSGNQNTVIGTGALDSNTSGSDNTASGFLALTMNTSGSNNTALGSSAGGNINTGSNNIDIGNFGNSSDGTSANHGVIRVGTAGKQTSFFAAGISGVMTGGAGTAVLVDANGQLGTVSSSRRYKEDIEDLGDDSLGLLHLRPVKFRYRQPYADGSKPIEYGLIAEEVAEVYPDLVVKNADGQVETVQYHKLTPMLLNELQRERRERSQVERDQKVTIEALQTQVSALQKALDALMASNTEARGGPVR